MRQALKFRFKAQQAQLSEWLYVKTTDRTGAPVPPHAATTDPKEALLADEIEALVRGARFLAAVRAAGRDPEEIDLALVDLDVFLSEIPGSATSIGTPLIK